MIRALADDEQVTEAGAYKVSMARYHGQDICPGPSISSSGIRTIVNDSPWHFWARSELNPKRYPDPEESDALVMGKATHALILGDEVFDEHFIYVPPDAPRQPTQQQLQAYEEGRATDVGKHSVEWWRDFDQKAKSRSFLTDVQIKHIGYMSENVRRNPEAVEALTGKLTEVSMIWQDEATGVWLKSRPDVIPDNGFDFADLKTFAPRTKEIERAVHIAITDHDYHMQMALAVMGAKAVFGTSASECILVMVQSNPPYTVTPVKLDADTLYWARCQVRHGIDIFAKCLEAGHWPMPVEGILTYSLPPSIAGRLAEAQFRGELPNLER